MKNPHFLSSDRSIYESRELVGIPLSQINIVELKSHMTLWRINALDDSCGKFLMIDLNTFSEASKSLRYRQHSDSGNLSSDVPVQEDARLN